MLLLGVGIFLGFIIARRTGKKNAHIQELEEQLAQSRKEMEGYRALVNEHFMKTSELVDQMTASYRAIFMHLANGAQALSGQPQEASLSLPEDEIFAHVRPLKKALQEGEAIPEAERKEVAPGPDEETEAEKIGPKIAGEALEKTATAAGSEEVEMAETQSQGDRKATETDQGGIEPGAPRKDENT